LVVVAERPRRQIARVELVFLRPQKVVAELPERAAVGDIDGGWGPAFLEVRILAVETGEGGFGIGPDAEVMKPLVDLLRPLAGRMGEHGEAVIGLGRFTTAREFGRLTRHGIDSSAKGSVGVRYPLAASGRVSSFPSSLPKGWGVVKGVAMRNEDQRV